MTFPTSAQIKATAGQLLRYLSSMCLDQFPGGGVRSGFRVWGVGTSVARRETRQTSINRGEQTTGRAPKHGT